MLSVKASPKSHFVRACGGLGLAIGNTVSQFLLWALWLFHHKRLIEFLQIPNPHLKTNRGDRQSSDKVSLRNYLGAETNKQKQQKKVDLSRNQKPKKKKNHSKLSGV